ncbi:hypothetical protein, partial [Pseudomonas syringae group genomosp. 7]|uniref:hypothetical protein n=1 Tax=Pseudomonas syringae group genomosp. 7 TaxID=251699 RepID=UPI0037706550
AQCQDGYAGGRPTPQPDKLGARGGGAWWGSFLWAWGLCVGLVLLWCGCGGVWGVGWCVGWVCLGFLLLVGWFFFGWFCCFCGGC